MRLRLELPLIISPRFVASAASPVLATPAPPMTQTFTVHPTHPQPRLIRQAADVLRGGGVIAYPTDSSYALGCQLDDAEAAKRIRSIRGLEAAHYLTLVLRDLSAIGRFA